MVAFTTLFRSPYSVPNGLQLVHHEDAAGSSDADGSLWIADQITDRVALVDTHQVRGEDDHYCVAKHIREIPSESSNTSGMTYGGGSLWLAANGAATAWRSEKETDAGSGDGIVLEVDPATGKTHYMFRNPEDTGWTYWADAGARVVKRRRLTGPWAAGQFEDDVSQ